MPPRARGDKSIVGLRFLCPGSVFNVPNEVFPGVVKSISKRKNSKGKEELFVVFDGEDKRTYYFDAADVRRWVSAADKAGMNDRESDSEEGEQPTPSDAGETYEIDLGPPSPDARKGTVAWREQQQRRAARAARAATSATTATRNGSSRFPSPSSSSKRTASLNELSLPSSPGRNRGGGGKKGASRTRSSPSTSFALLVPLLAALTALAAYAVSWLALSETKLEKLKFGVPW